MKRIVHIKNGVFERRLSLSAVWSGFMLEAHSSSLIAVGSEAIFLSLYGGSAHLHDLANPKLLKFSDSDVRTLTKMLILISTPLATLTHWLSE
jgi:hypothetical protein